MLRRFFLPGFSALALAVLAASAFPGSASAQSGAVISLSVNPSSITEEGGTQTVTVSASVNLSTADFCFYVDVGAHTASNQTATEGTDYTGVTHKLVYFSNSNTTSTTFDVAATDDSVSDGGETIQVHSWKAGNQPSCVYNHIDTYGSTNLTLNDSDPKANLSVSPTEISENSGATVVTVTAALNLQGTRTLGSAVEYAVSAGKTGDSATQGTDYTTAGSLTLTLPSGTANAQVTGTFTLTPGRDLLSESDETITVRGVSTNDGDAGEASITLKNSVFAPCTSQSTENLKTDCRALEALYNSAGGADWKSSANWKIDDSLDKWHGVKTKDGRVSKIELYENQLTGTIPSDIANLSGLTLLDLGANSLSGTIPSGLSSLSKLIFLFLDGNSLSGTIPDLSSTNLGDLLLHNNQLSGTIPAWLNNKDLTRLKLHDNRLTGTIPDLSGLDRLRDFDLSNNRLSGTIPRAESMPGGLSQESSGGARSEGAQANATGNLPNTGKLNLSDNSISGTIPDLSSLNGVYDLNFSRNRLGGELNASHLPTNLNVLDLSENRLSGTIPDLSVLTKLLLLYLHDNNFSGTIPDLSSIARAGIDLSGNSLSGSIDQDDFHEYLYSLYLNDNKLTGSVNLSGINLKVFGFWGNPGLDLTNVSLHSSLSASEIDRFALDWMYRRNGGPGWTNRSGWPGPKHTGAENLNHWHGVTAGSDGRASVLNLSSNNLTGEISGSIEALTSLTEKPVRQRQPERYRSLEAERHFRPDDSEPVGDEDMSSFGPEFHHVEERYYVYRGQLRPGGKSEQFSSFFAACRRAGGRKRGE